MTDRLGPVIHLSTAKSWRGGEQQALWLAQGLVAKGIETRVIARPGAPMAARARAAGIPVDEIRVHNELDCVAAWRIAGICKKHHATILHAHDAHGVAIARWAGWLAGVKRIAARRVDFQLKSVKKYATGIEKVICVSEAIRKICADAGVPESQLAVVADGVDLDRLRDEPSDPRTVRAEFVDETRKKRLVVLNVASLADHKDQMTLLESMNKVLAQVPQAFFLIVGEGELEAQLRHRAKVIALDEDVLQFTGFRDDVPALFKACDLFVMSSHHEGLCTSVMDAMGAGKAVVATQVGGLPELVEDRVTGRLVPARDPNALAASLIEVLKDKKTREKMGRNGLRKAEAHFSANTMVDKTIEVYQSV